MRKTTAALFITAGMLLTSCMGKTGPQKRFDVDSVSMKRDTLKVFATQEDVKDAKQDTFVYRFADKGHDLRYTNAYFSSRNFEYSYDDSTHSIDTTKPILLRAFAITDVFKDKDSSQENVFVLDRFGLNKNDMDSLHAPLHYMIGGRVPGHYYYHRELEKVSP